MLGHSALSETPLSALPEAGGALPVLTGRTFNRCAALIPFCPVSLHRASTGARVAVTVSNAVGEFSFTNPLGGPFWVRVVNPDGTLAGTSHSNLMPS